MTTPDRTCSRCGLPIETSQPESHHVVIFSSLYPEQRDRYREAHPDWRDLIYGRPIDPWPFSR